MVVHTADVHSRRLPYQYAPNTPDRNPGSCRCRVYAARTRSAHRFRQSCKQDPTAAPSHRDRGRHIAAGDPGGRANGRGRRSLHLTPAIRSSAPIFNVFNGEAEVRAGWRAFGTQGMALATTSLTKGVGALGLQLMNNGPSFPSWRPTTQVVRSQRPARPKLNRFIQPYTIYNVKGIRPRRHRRRQYLIAQ